MAGFKINLISALSEIIVMYLLITSWKQERACSVICNFYHNHICTIVEKHTLCHQRMKIMKKGTPTGMMQKTANQRAAKLERPGQDALKSDLQ
jgi:hypothetical protein